MYKEMFLYNTFLFFISRMLCQYINGTIYKTLICLYIQWHVLFKHLIRISKYTPFIFI